MRILCTPATADGSTAGGTALMPQVGGSVTLPTAGEKPPATPASAEKKEEAKEDPLLVDIKAQIAKARQDEKQKMYDRLAASEIEVKAANAKVAEVLAQNTKLLEQLSKVAPAEPGGKAASAESGGKEAEKKSAQAVSAEAVMAAADAAARSALERAEKELFGPRIKALEEQNRRLTLDLQTKELAEYRSHLIQANKDVIIPELVTGSTKEELETSLITAKQVFAKTAQALAERAGGDLAAIKNLLPPTIPINKGATSTDAGGKGASVATLSDDEYRAKRAELLRSASAEARKAYVGG